jgi:hypothetical protein
MDPYNFSESHPRGINEKHRIKCVTERVTGARRGKRTWKEETASIVIVRNCRLSTSSRFRFSNKKFLVTNEEISIFSHL